jgi:mRNA interferase MazF
VRRGDIYWVDFGTGKGSEQGGRRPALIIQNDTGNANSQTTIIAAITTTKRGFYSFHVDVSPRESGLPEDSVVLLEQLLTISKSRLIGEPLGHLSNNKMKEVDRAIRVSLGLAP